MFRSFALFALLVFVVGGIASCTFDIKNLPEETTLLDNKNQEQENKEPVPAEPGDPVLECKDFIQGFVDAMNIFDCDEAGINLDEIIIGDCDETATLLTRLDQFRFSGCSLSCSQWFAYADTHFVLANYAQAKEMLSVMEGSGCVIGCTEMMLSVQVNLKAGDFALAQMKVMQMDAASCEETAEALALCRAAGACA